MKYRIVCYNTILHRKVSTSKTTNFEEALNLYYEECDKKEGFIDVRLYKGLTKIGSCFMGNQKLKPTIQ